ncbi:MAG: LPS-assembly protein LptD [Methylotenera sp.]|nr:LPS-assembly protein LptD [Oligoflexia bacterium]
MKHNFKQWTLSRWISERTVLVPVPLLAALAIGLPMAAWGAPESSPMHSSGDKTYWDRKSNRVTLTGHAAVSQVGETLTADEIKLDLDNRTLDAKGNVIYIATGSVIHGDEMHFNLDTRTGTIMGGRVSNENFTLSGERINKLGEGRFQTHRGEYTTCKDCPQSWSLNGADVDLQINGYAFLKDVTAKIKDAPVFWLPYLVVPLKTRRQSGLLFPRFGLQNGGVTFVQPFFWAINRSSDLTIGLGTYGGRGRRAELEGRYSLGDRSSGIANFYYLNDRTFAEYLNGIGLGNQSRRYALNVSQSQVLPFEIDEKLRIIEVSDNLYPSKVGDLPNQQEAFLPSILSLSHATNQVSIFASARRYRNIISTDPDPRKFDVNTVQVFPEAVLTTNDKFLFEGPIAAGITLGATNFTRAGPDFDRDQLSTPGAVFATGTPPRLGIDPLRKATRVSITPSLYTTFRPWDVLSFVPSLQYKQYFYSFHNVAPNLSRSYLLLQLDLSAQLERIYDTDDVNVPKVKHLVRPLLNYSAIPAYTKPRHPFIDQINYANDRNVSGYNFDNEDIVPLDSTSVASNYFPPQGNALSYGFDTQLIRRKGNVLSDGASYQRSIDLSAGQSLNFRQLREQEGSRKPLSRFFSNLGLEFDKWSGSADYFYIPYQPITDNTSRHLFSGSAAYTFEKAVRQNVLQFERSIAVNYAYNRATSQSQTKNFRGSLIYSLNDYVMPSISISYDLILRKWQEAISRVSFQSPSQCWKFDVSFAQRAAPILNKDRDTGWDTSFGVDLSLNLTGSGFGGVSEVTSKTAAQ